MGHVAASLCWEWVGGVTAPLYRAWGGWGLAFWNGGRKMAPWVGVCCLLVPRAVLQQPHALQVPLVG